MPDQARARRFRYLNDFVLEIFWEKWFDSRSDLEHMCNARILQHAQIRGSLQVTKVQAINYFVHYE